MSKKNKNKAVPAINRAEPNADQRQAIEHARQCWKELPERAEMRLKVDADNVAEIECPHSDPGGFTAMLAATFGTRSHAYIDTIMPKLLNVAGKRGTVASENEANAALAFIAAVAPSDEMEASMALQMHATNELAIDLLTRARHSHDREMTADYVNLATKLSRTFTGQIEALSKLRRGGEQIVKYVHVHEGGQAVVAGTIHQRGGGNSKALEQPHEQAPDAPLPALPGVDPAQD